MTVGAVSTTPITIEEFDKLDLPEDREWELRHGEVVEMSFPDLYHRDLQLRLAVLLQQAFPNAHVLVEYPFQIEETSDKRSADVALTSLERLQASRAKRALIGAPELVVEVLSPSNSLTELKRDRRVFFSHGMLLYLILDPEDNTIEVFRKGEKSPQVLTIEENLQLSLFGETQTIPVRAIFTGITLP
jgi:Uma2 family endonuclease